MASIQCHNKCTSTVALAITAAAPAAKPKNAPNLLAYRRCALVNYTESIYNAVCPGDNSLTCLDGGVTI